MNKSTHISYLFFLFLMILVHTSWSQNEPYYEPVGKRSLEDLRFLPNLDTEQRRIYLLLLGAARFSNSNIEPSSEIFSAKSSTNLFWGANLGFNSADNFLFEIGYAKNPIFLNLEFKERPSSNNSFPITSGGDFNEFSFRVKKKIVQVDKVAQKAGLFLIAGLLYTPDFPNKNLGSATYASRQFYGPNIKPDTVFHSISTSSSKHAFAFEFGLELSGRLNEQIGIGVFAKSTVRPSGSLNSNLRYSVNDGSGEIYNQQLSPLNINLGVLFYFNAVNWVKYKSKVSK